ncbi:MAG: metallophosphoesterase [Anaerolineae bacterium]|nr:metallophosphoesterase [Anaerolineae bacterium]
MDDSLLRTSAKGWHWVGSTWAKLAALVGIGGAAAAGLTFFYASQIEPRWMAFPTHRIKLRGLSPVFDGYRIAQISDLHLCEGRILNPDRLRRIVRQVNDKRPDLILITGDFVSALDSTSRAGIAHLIRLQARDGVFAIPGNHDYWCGITDVIEAVKHTGIRFLCNDHMVVRRRGDALVIAGVDDIWEGKPNLDTALRGAPANAPVILMAHEPNYAPVAAQDGRIAFQLSGHSHGGQVRIPGLGPLALPDQAWRYPMGFYQVGDMQLYVSRGVGMAEIPFRLNCRPEVTLFSLTAL